MKRLLEFLSDHLLHLLLLVFVFIPIVVTRCKSEPPGEWFNLPRNTAPAARP